jgi:hypothetical protein
MPFCHILGRPDSLARPSTLATIKVTNKSGLIEMTAEAQQDKRKQVQCQLIDATLIDSQLTFATLIDNPFD